MIKWNKQTFNDFEVDPNLGMEVLRAQIFDLSNVPTDKQKLMYKGKILKVLPQLTLVKSNNNISSVG